MIGGTLSPATVPRAEVSRKAGGSSAIPAMEAAQTTVLTARTGRTPKRPSSRPDTGPAIASPTLKQASTTPPRP